MKVSQDISIQYSRLPVREPCAAGEIRITTSQNQRAGRCFYTDWIETGIQDGLMDLSFHLVDTLGVDEIPLDAPRILYGNPQVFMQSSYIPALPLVQLGAFADAAGRFQLGVRLESPMAPGTLCIRWLAGKTELQSEKEQNAEKAQQFYISNPPKYLRPGMKYTFGCVKSDDLTGRILWQTVGEEAGTINKFGTYTAPQKQGVYEVQALLEGTDLSSRIYVIVKSD